MTLKHASIAKSRQDVTLTYHYLLGDDKVRVRIRANAYRDQSQAVAEVWRDRWVEVASLDPGEMETPEALYVRDNWKAEQNFDYDLDALLRLVQFVLGGVR